MSKKQVKIISSFFAVLISVFIVFISGDTSSLSLPFKKTPQAFISPKDLQEQVQGSSVSIAPTISIDQPTDETSFSPSEEQQGYKVIKVVDGDTFDVDINGKLERLRMIGIDTPETVDPRKSVQCFGKEASNKAKEILSSQFVTLEADETQGDRDKYGRLLRYAFLSDGTNYGLFMISEGYAHEYTYHLPYKYQIEFKQAEIDARSSNKGLWSPETCSGNK